MSYIILSFLCTFVGFFAGGMFANYMLTKEDNKQEESKVDPQLVFFVSLFTNNPLDDIQFEINSMHKYGKIHICASSPDYPCVTVETKDNIKLTFKGKTNNNYVLEAIRQIKYIKMTEQLANYEHNPEI